MIITECKLPLRSLTILFYFLTQGYMTFSQLETYPIQASYDFIYPSLNNARTMADSTQLELPFWDDFSTVYLSPDSSLWLTGSGTANVMPGVGIAPPTVNVAVFDGWNALGKPYSQDDLHYGAGDSLVSRFIDLSTVPPAIRNTVFLSFFWQKEGSGEMPDAPDSIRLQVRDDQKQWITLWSIAGPDVSVADEFFQEIVQINDPSFFHPYFQFRFQSFNRLSGGFDNWNIDYIYFNYGRNASDLAYEDRALTSLPGSFLKGYTAMPYDHFILDLSSNLQPVFVDFYNMHNLVQPIEYTALIRDTTKIFDVMDHDAVLDPNPAGFERRRIYSSAVDPSVFDDQNDTLSLCMETVFYINSGDTLAFNGKVDYRVNDTTIAKVLLSDQLAYDDGSAEWAAGLSDRGGKIAYRFIVNKPDGLTALKIYFPEFGSGTSGQNFTLMIWDNLHEGVEGRLLVEQHVVGASEGLNQFVTYDLGRPVAVADTFFVGYEQNVSGFFAVGLDKNTDSGSEIFFNTDGVWEQNTKLIGSLLIRPVFGFKKAVGLQEESLFKDLHVYPNPTSGWVRVEGYIDGIDVMDMLGRPSGVNRIFSKTILYGEQTQNDKGKKHILDLDLSDLPNGMYFIRVHKEGHARLVKVVLKR